MIGRIVRGAIRGVKQELTYSTGGWSRIGGMGWGGSATSSAAGKTVTAESALCVSAVWACVRCTAELIASLPLDQYEKQGSQSVRIKVEDDLSDILTMRPNSRQTAVEFWESMIAPMVLRGNGCAERLMVGKSLVGLDPLPNATPHLKSDRTIEYVFYDRGQREVLPQEKVFHLRGFGSGDGVGLSAIRHGANSIGAALAADESASKLFSNGIMPAGVLQSDQILDEEQRGQLQTLLETFAGSSKAGRTLVLEAGLTWNQVQMNPEDAQLLETRRFQVEDVCRWFGMPPIVIGHSSEGQTMWGSGIEHILLSWLSLGINPLLRKVEARVRRDLVDIGSQRRRYFEFNREAMMQMDSKAKGDFLLKMRMAGLMSGDEGRDKLNLPARGGASDDLFIQTSMAPVDLVERNAT